MFPECSEHNEYVIIYIYEMVEFTKYINAHTRTRPRATTFTLNTSVWRREKKKRTQKDKQKTKRTNRVHNSEPSQTKFVHKENGITQNATLEQCSHIESVMPADRAYNVHAEHQTKGIEKYKIDVTFFDSPLVYSSVLRLFFV